MALPVARTRDEAHLYMDMRPCPKCGKSDVHWDSALTSDEGAPARRYSGSCPGCQTPREFIFRLPERPLLPGPGDVVLFGGDEPSELLDAGEWLYVADVCAQAAAGGPGREPGPVLSAEARESLIVAVAAMDEVLKFIPPEKDEVPRAGFWSDRGRTLRQTEPGRFRRRRLLTIRNTYRDALARAAS
ncbi:hypothetical protein [Cryptosporangium minutisporangium]